MRYHTSVSHTIHHRLLMIENAGHLDIYISYRDDTNPILYCLVKLYRFFCVG